MIAFTSLLNTWKIFRKNWLAFSLPVLSDLLFLIIFGRIIWQNAANKLFTTLGDVLVLVNTNKPESTFEALITGSDVMRSIQYNQQIKALIGQAYQQLIVFVFWVMLIWIIFQGFNYWYLKKLSKQDFDSRLFFKQFFVDNVIYFTSVVLIIAIFGKLSTIIRWVPLWQQTFIVLGFLLLLFTVHSALVSYRFMGVEQKVFWLSFKKGFNWNYIVMWIVIFAYFYIVNWIMIFLFFNQVVMVLGGIVFVLTGFNLAKLYIIETVKKIK